MGHRDPFGTTPFRKATGAAGGLSIANEGTDPILYLAAGGARAGYGLHIPAANQLGEKLILVDGSYTGAVALKASNNILTYRVSIVIDMDANDTAKIKFQIAGGAKVVDIIGDATNMKTYFSVKED